MVLIGPADPIGLAKFIAETAQWVAKVVNTRRSKREQRAPYVLREAGVLVTAMRTLD